MITVLAAVGTLGWWIKQHADRAADRRGTTLTSEYTPLTPVFLEAVTIPPPDKEVDVAVGTNPPGRRMQTRADYRRLFSGLCLTNLVPSGTQLTVENVNNSQRIQCRSYRGPISNPAVGIMINTNDFPRLGDINDAPLYVRLIWKR